MTPVEEEQYAAAYVGAEYVAVTGPHRGQALRVAAYDPARDRYDVETEFGGRFTPTSGLTVRCEVDAQGLVRDAWWRGVRAGLLYAQADPPCPHAEEARVLRAAFAAGAAFARATWPKPTDETY